MQPIASPRALILAGLGFLGHVGCGTPPSPLIIRPYDRQEPADTALSEDRFVSPEDVGFFPDRSTDAGTREDVIYRDTVSLMDTSLSDASLIDASIDTSIQNDIGFDRANIGDSPDASRSDVSADTSSHIPSDTGHDAGVSLSFQLTTGLNCVADDLRYDTDARRLWMLCRQSPRIRSVAWPTGVPAVVENASFGLSAEVPLFSITPLPREQFAVSGIRVIYSGEMTTLQAPLSIPSGHHNTGALLFLGDQLFASSQTDPPGNQPEISYYDVSSAGLISRIPTHQHIASISANLSALEQDHPTTRQPYLYALHYGEASQGVRALPMIRIFRTVPLGNRPVIRFDSGVPLQRYPRFGVSDDGTYVFVGTEGYGGRAYLSTLNPDPMETTTSNPPPREIVLPGTPDHLSAVFSGGYFYLAQRSGSIIQVNPVTAAAAVYLTLPAPVTAITAIGDHIVVVANGELHRIRSRGGTS